MPERRRPSRRHRPEQTGRRWPCDRDRSALARTPSARPALDVLHAVDRCERHRISHRHDAPTGLIRALEGARPPRCTSAGTATRWDHGCSASPHSAAGTFRCVISRTRPSNDSLGPPARARSSTCVDRRRALCVDSVESSSELRTIVEVGASLPIANGSAGKVFLAWSRPTPSASHRRPILIPTIDRTGWSSMVATTKRRGMGRSRSENGRRASRRSARRCSMRTGTWSRSVSVSGPSNRIGQLGATRTTRPRS